MSDRQQAVWSFAGMSEGARLLDVGCGRGEIIVRAGLQGVWGVGIDYSREGIRLAQKAVDNASGELSTGGLYPGLVLAEAQQLPFADDTFDNAIMSDVVEHLLPDELESALKEVCRVLMPGGRLLVHTMPNLWYYRYGYPLYRLVRRAWGEYLPRDPRHRGSRTHVHVNEQTPRNLSRALRRAGFGSHRVWLYDYRDYVKHGRLIGAIMRLMTALPGLRSVFCDDIFAVATVTECTQRVQGKEPTGAPNATQY